MSKAHRVRTRADGTVEWRAVIYDDGIQSSRSFTVPSNSQRDADRKADEVRAQLRAERVAAAKTAPRKPAAGTVAEYATNWLNRKRATRESSTVRGYRHIIRQICDRFGTIPLDELTADDVQAWYNELIAAGMTSHTLAHYHSVFRAMLIQARKGGKVSEVATYATERPTVIRKQMRLPRDSDVSRTLGALPIGVVIAQRLAAATGLRAGELCALKYSAIRGREIVVESAVSVGENGPYLKAAKSNRARTVDYDTMRLLALHRSRQRREAREKFRRKFDAKGGYVLARLEVDPTGHAHMSSPELSKLWAKSRGKLDVGTHGLRHWYATKLLESGTVSLADVAAWLGHAQASTTAKIYIHTDPARRLLAPKVMGPLLHLKTQTTPPA